MPRAVCRCRFVPVWYRGAEEWLWSSLSAARPAVEAVRRLTVEELVRRGDWIEFVNAPMTEAQEDAIRVCIRRNRPYGSDDWTQATAARLGLQSSIRNRGGQHRRAAGNCLTSPGHGHE